MFDRRIALATTRNRFQALDIRGETFLFLYTTKTENKKIPVFPLLYSSIFLIGFTGEYSAESDHLCPGTVLDHVRCGKPRFLQ